MGNSNRSRRKQVRLTVFDNEPMARLAEQRLWQSGVPCIIRSLRGGPGLWGSAYNLPHDLCVYEGDEARAREVLNLPEPGEGATGDIPPRAGFGLWVAVVVITVVLALGIILPMVARLG